MSHAPSFAGGVSFYPMPYDSISDSKLPSNVKELPTEKKKMWVATFNSVYGKCKDDGGDNKNCETQAFRIANGVVKKERGMSWIDRLTENIKRMIEKELPQKRSVGIDVIAMRIQTALRNKYKGSDDWWKYRLGRLMYQNGQLYGVFSTSEGEILRADLAIDEDGNVEVGDFVEVKEEYTPVMRSAVTIVRQKDGTERIFMIAATSIINRVGEIDSKLLFDNMMKRARETEFYPLIDMLHLGSTHDAFEVGQVDFIARSEHVYLASAILDTSKTLGRLMADDIKSRKSGINWGCSIEYFPLDGETETLDVGEGVDIDVYQDGLNTRIALLPEEQAASWFTGVVKERERKDVDEKQLETLRALFNNDEEFNKFIGTIEGVNERVAKDKLVSRDKGSESPDPEDAGQTTEEPEGETQPNQRQVELDDKLVELIVGEVVSRMDKSEADSKVLGEIKQGFDALNGQLSGITERQDKFDSRLAKMEEDDDKRKKRWIEDLPSSVQDDEKIVVTYRASRDNSNGDGKEEPVSMADKASQTLANLPTRRGGSV